MTDRPDVGDIPHGSGMTFLHVLTLRSIYIFSPPFIDELSFFAFNMFCLAHFPFTLDFTPLLDCGFLQAMVVFT